MLVLVIGSVPLPLSDSNSEVATSSIGNPIDYHSIAYTDHGPINIVSDADFITQAALETWQGNGSILNPFIIDGYNITYRGYNIRIVNVTAYFVISNCYLSSNASGLLIDPYDYGICLINVDHASIRYNQIINNTDCGIYCESSYIDGRYNLLLGNRYGLVFDNVTGNNFSYCDIVDSIEIAAWILNCIHCNLQSFDVSKKLGLGLLMQDSFDCTVSKSKFNNGSVEVQDCNNCGVSYNGFYNGSKLLVDNSSHMSLIENRITSSKNYGINISCSDHCVISQNWINSSTYSGIATVDSLLCNYTGNRILNCKEGILINNVTSSLISHNSFNNQTNYEVRIESGTNNWIYANLVSDQGDYIFLDDGIGNHWDDGLFLGNFIEGIETGPFQINGTAGSIDHYARPTNLTSDLNYDYIVYTTPILMKLDNDGGILVWLMWNIEPATHYFIIDYTIIVDEEERPSVPWPGPCIIKVDILNISQGIHKYSCYLRMFNGGMLGFGFIFLHNVSFFYPGFYSAIDDDMDDMPDEWETIHSLNTMMNDSDLDPDFDDLSNLDEYYWRTDPHNPDSDQDLMLDGWEAHYDLNPLFDDSSEDPDFDDLSNLEEFIFRTNPKNNDSDSDLIPDNYEIYNGLNPWVDDAQGDLDLDSLSNLLEYQIGTSANNSDSDYDLANDAWEYKYGLNPLDQTDGTEDPDHDGIPNYMESSYGTNPFEIDSDFDGYTDLWEIQHGFNPMDPHVAPLQIFTANFGFIVLGVLGITTLFGGYRIIKHREISSLKQQIREYEEERRRALEELTNDANHNTEATSQIESDLD